MSAAKDEKKGFLEWLQDKLMHNQNDSFGYELYHKGGMSAREEEQKKAYKEALEERKKWR